MKGKFMKEAARLVLINDHLRWGLLALLSREEGTALFLSVYLS